MKILLTGTTGYIGKRLLPLLLEEGHEVICCVRDRKRIPDEKPFNHPSITFLEIDFLNDSLPQLPFQDLDVAFYLIHSMQSTTKGFDLLEEKTAVQFMKLVATSRLKQIVYLGGIANEIQLSDHLKSRKNVESILNNGLIPLTVIRAGIIVGSGSASFEIIRDLVEKLPVMITPKWLKTKCQPIGVRDVMRFLQGVMLKEETYFQVFDIGGPDVLTYKEMLLQFASCRGLQRYIFTLPVMSPRISSYWLYFVTSTSYPLAVNLVNSMKIEVIARDNRLQQILGIQPMTYKQAVELAFERIEQHSVVSSWKDALASSGMDNNLLDHANIPQFGCNIDFKEKEITGLEEKVLSNIWSIGGERGWYYGNWLWKFRGFIDKLWGGVGLRRGRTHPTNIHSGDSLDFWRVLAADKGRKRLLLYAEMILPGEAWLEFKIVERGQKSFLQQTATFRPKGMMGRLYWLAVLPLHVFLFEGMINNLIRFREK
ncbi:MAG: DUF2867 domain-containing protein [Bacteroidetes bacterium]|nr:DUF2867 domain-containing protein [Bacteroidota bacterium]